MKQGIDKEQYLELKHQVLTHGLHLLRHFSCDSPVRYMTYAEAISGFVSLHMDNTAHLYQPDGHRRGSPAHAAPVPYAGLTSIKLKPGRLMGWGPGPVLTLLDSDLQPLREALEPLDVRVCQAVERSTELVTAGEGNVCVWSVIHMMCKVKVVEGLSHSVFTQMALAPPRPHRPHTAFAVCGKGITVVDLKAGKVLEHKKNLCLRDISALVYCSQQDCLAIASKDLSIRVWGPDWQLHAAFVGHNGVVNSLLYCSESGVLLSASLDCTVRCWNVEEMDEAQCVHTEEDNAPLHMGGPGKGGTFFSFSKRGVDFWTFRSLYTLHCRLGGDARVPLRQILVPPFPSPYPARVLCVSGDSDVVLVAAETGAVLTSFRAKQRVACADYCLHKEILLVLTEVGTVLQANALTNPVTLMDEWQGRGLGPWQREECATGDSHQNRPSPGRASCLALYSYVAEPWRALEEWRSLQEERGIGHRNKSALDDAKNKFLVILGHSGGCVSVLKLNNGTVLYRTPAHNGQRVTTMQTDPDNSYLLTIGEDKSVLVWRVYPYNQECLTLHMSLDCGQPPSHMALLWPQIALALQEQHSALYSLTHFSLLNQSRTDQPPSENHLDRFIGLCVCPELRVFASGSLDGTVHICTEENHLIRTLQLNAEPECMAFSGLGGHLLVGIRGDLFRINCVSLLPHHYQLPCALNSEPVADLPIMRTKTIANKQKTAGQVVTAEDSRDNSTKDPVFYEDMWRQKQEFEALRARNEDLLSLLQGTVKCKRSAPPSTAQTRKEAFDRYMKMMHCEPPNIKIGCEDMFDLQALLFPPKPREDPPCTPPILEEGFFPDPKLARPVALEAGRGKDDQLKPAPAQCNTIGFKPNSVLVGRLWPKVVAQHAVPKEPFRLQDHLGLVDESEEEEEEVTFVVYEDDEEDIITPPEQVQEAQIIEEPPPPPPSPPPPPPPPAPPPPPVEPRVVVPLQPPKCISPRPKPKTPTPPPSPPRIPPPVPPRTPTPEIPGFLKQFAGQDWFKDMYPDHRSIPGSLSPDEFSLQLLVYLNNCSAPFKLKVVAVMQVLHRQGLLQNTDAFLKGLIDSVPKYIRPNMSHEEHVLINEMFNLLVCMKSDGRDVALKLLTLLAYQTLGLRRTVLCLLKKMGVHEAKQWLVSEVESWDSELQDPSDVWKSLYERTDEWLKLWTSKYKEHNRSLSLNSAVRMKNFTFITVDVLNYFCSVRKDEYMRAQLVAPEGRKDTVLLSQTDCSYQPIFRLGENYSMARTRRRPGIILPPLPQRPFLMGVPKFITLPLHRVNLCPFPMPSDENRLKASPRRYFILERSYVDYYR